MEPFNLYKYEPPPPTVKLSVKEPVPKIAAADDDEDAHYENWKRPHEYENDFRVKPCGPHCRVAKCRNEDDNSGNNSRKPPNRNVTSGKDDNRTNRIGTTAVSPASSKEMTKKMSMPEGIEKKDVVINSKSTSLPTAETKTLVVAPGSKVNVMTTTNSKLSVESPAHSMSCLAKTAVAPTTASSSSSLTSDTLFNAAKKSTAIKNPTK